MQHISIFYTLLTKIRIYTTDTRPGTGIKMDYKMHKKVKVGKDQEKAQSEKDSPSKNPGWEKTKLTIRYLYHETHLKPNEQLFSQ